MFRLNAEISHKRLTAAAHLSTFDDVFVGDPLLLPSLGELL